MSTKDARPPWCTRRSTPRTAGLTPQEAGERVLLGIVAPAQARVGAGVGGQQAHRRPGTRRHRDQRTLRGDDCSDTPATGAGTRTRHGGLRRRRMARPAGPPGRRSAAPARLARRLPRRAGPHRPPVVAHLHRRSSDAVLLSSSIPHAPARRAQRDQRLPSRRHPRPRGRRRLRPRRLLRAHDAGRLGPRRGGSRHRPHPRPHAPLPRPRPGWPARTCPT